MAIKIKSTQNSSKAYFQLDDKALSDGKEVGSKSKSKESSTLFRKMTKYSHNILKSTKNLAFDIVGDYVPNISDIKDQISETAAEATAEARDSIGELVSFGKKKLAGSGKSVKDITKEQLNKQKSDIMKRLKSGKLYMTTEEKQKEQFEAEFSFDSDFSFDGGDDFDLGDMSDTFVTTSEDDTLPDQPFAAPVRKGAVHYKNVSAERRQKRSKSNVKRSKPSSHKGGGGSSTRVGELRLGDELVSETTSQVGQSILEQNEELWARSFAAEENRFGKLLGYQTNIVTSLNNIVEFNNNIVAENVRAQMEYQAKAMAAQEDLLALTKELKDTMIATATYTPNLASSKSLLNGNRLNSKEYANQIKQNIGDMMSANGLGQIGMMLGMIPSIADSAGSMGGMVDPMNFLLKNGFKSLLTRQTKSKFYQLNRNMDNFGASFLGKMNELAEYGTGFGQFIGKALGSRSTRVTQANLGLKDPNQIVGWTSKSDRTLNDVIPGYLSKMLAQLSGGEETFYDYKTGRFKSTSSIKKDYELRSEQAYTNDTITAYSQQMFSNYAEKHKGNKDFEKNREAVYDAMSVINKNIVKSKIPVDFNRLVSDKKYKEMITQGVNSDIKEVALGVFINGFKNMTSSERMALNSGGYMKAGMNVQKNLDQISNDYIQWGGASALGEVTQSKELSEFVRDFERNRNIQFDENADIRDTENIRRMGSRAKAIQELADLIDNTPGSENTEEVKKMLEKLGVSNTKELMKQALELKRNQSVAARKQEIFFEAGKGGFIDMLVGTKFRHNGVNTVMGNAADAMNGWYGNLLGTGGPDGRGLWGVNNEYDTAVNQYYDLSQRRLDRMKNSKVAGAMMRNGVIGKYTSNAFDDMQQNLDSAREENLRNINEVNPYSWGNMEDIENPLIRLASVETRELYNKFIMDTGYGGTSPSKALKSEFLKTIIQSDTKLQEFIKQHFIGVKKYGCKNLNDVYNKISKDENFMSEISSYITSVVSKQKKKYKNILDKAYAKVYGKKKQKFARGGIVKGRRSGDTTTVMANGGEMFLNETQQKKLFNLIDSGDVDRFKESAKSGLDKLDIHYDDLADCIRDNGVAGALKAYADQIKDNPSLRKFINRLGGIIGKTNNALGGYGDVISLGSKRRGLARGMGIAGAVAGGVAGSVFGGHPLLGAAIGGTAFKKIGDLFKMKYPTLKGSLLAAGYSDAPKMNKKDLYALITNMALSKDPYEREKGESLITTDEFAELESAVTTKNGFDKFIDKVKAVPKFFKNRALDIKLMFHRTLKYKGLVNVLNNRFNSGPDGFDVTSYDKESLYALVQSLPDKTKADKQFKATIMGMKEYKKLDKDIANYMTIGDTIRESVKDIPKKFVRAFRYGRLLPYRNIAKIYMNKEDMDEKEFLNMTKDPNDLYLNLLSWEGTKDKGDIFRILKKQKSFMKLEIAATRIQGRNEGLSKEEIENKVNKIRSSFKQRKRFAGVAQILKSANRSKNPPDYDSMDPSDLYAAATALIEKGGKLGNALAASGQYKLLETTVKGKANSPKGFGNKIKGWINRKFGTNFGMSEKTGPDFGDSSDWSGMTDSASEHQSNLKSYMASLRKQGIRGKKARKLINEWMSRNQTFAAGGIVNGSSHGDHVGVLANGGEMVLNKETQGGLFGWLKSLGGGGNKENVKLASKAISKQNLKVSKIIKGDADQVAKKAIVGGGPFAGMISLLSQMNKTMASTLRVIGGNDEGEIDEKNKETIAGQINGISGGGSGDGKNGKGGGKWNWLKKNGGTLAKTSFYGLGTAAMAALSGRSLIKKIGRVKEDGIDGLLERESGTAFNADGSRKTGLQLALDRGGDASNRAIAQSVIQKVGMTAVEKSAGKTVGGFMGAARGFKTNAKKLLSSIGTSATDAATKNADDLLTKNLKGIEDTLLKFLKDPKIIKKLPKAAVGSLSKLTNFVKEIPKRIAQFAKNGIKNSAKSASNALKAVPMAGWIMAIASVVWDVANSLNDAPKYFHVAPKDVTGGMRATAGIVGGIKSLIVNLLSVTGVGAIIGVAIDMVIPTDWMVENVYKLIGGETARQELAEKQQKQKDVAASLGVDSDKLTEAQNNSLLSKGLNGIKALFSKKTYAELQEETALKKLNKGRTDGNKITAEQYRQATGSAAPMSESDKASARSDKDVNDAISKIKSLNVGKSPLRDFNAIASIYERVLKSGNTEGAIKIIEEARKKETKDIGAFPSTTSALTDAFSKKWSNLLNDSEVQAAGISNPTISSTKRPLATQMALYAKGRSSYEMLDAVVKAAGISQGAKFWGGDPTKGTVTQTLKSDHLGGNALDVSLGENKLAVLGKKAKQYGIEWGGNWSGGWDKPHFQDANPTQFAALGGIVKGFGSSTKFGDRVRMGLNPGEMVLNKVQQTSLLNMINRFTRNDYGDDQAHAMARLNESPLLTNTKADLKMIQEAIGIQQAIYAEQRRHNDVAEKFFNAILKMMAASSNQPAPSTLKSNENEDVSELLRGAAQIASSF